MAVENEPIPVTDHVSRLCFFTKINWKSNMAMPAAFLPRKGEPYLSIDWLEKSREGDLDKQLGLVRKYFADQGEIKLTEKKRFAILNVGKCTSNVHDATKMIIEFLFKPIPYRPLHSSITWPGIDDDIVAHTVATILSDSVELPLEPARLPL